MSFGGNWGSEKTQIALACLILSRISERPSRSRGALGAERDRAETVEAYIDFLRYWVTSRGRR